MTSDGTLTDHVRQAGRSTVRRHVAASCEQVFEVVSSGWLYPVWVVGAARMRAVDPGWPAVGSKLHHSVGLWPALLDDETEVLVCEPPRRIVLQARGWPVGEATVDLHLDPDPDDPDGACTASLGEDASHGPGRFVPPVLRRGPIRVRNTETLRRLAFIAEGMAANGRTPQGFPPAQDQPRRSSPRT